MTSAKPVKSTIEVHLQSLQEVFFTACTWYHGRSGKALNAKERKKLFRALREVEDALMKADAKRLVKAGHK